MDIIETIHSYKANGRRPNLQRMNWLLEAQGNPQQAMPTIQIVGTNGKGSTVAFLSQIFQKAGYKVGTFTSLYITHFNERIQINHQNITTETL